jgi:hypothetical protein
MEDRRDPVLKELSRQSEKRTVRFEAVEITYDKALQLMAEWWEVIRSEGINVAAEVQRRRSELQKPGPTIG